MTLLLMKAPVLPCCFFASWVNLCGATHVLGSHRSPGHAGQTEEVAQLPLDTCHARSQPDLAVHSHLARAPHMRTRPPVAPQPLPQAPARGKHCSYARATHKHAQLKAQPCRIKEHFRCSAFLLFCAVHFSLRSILATDRWQSHRDARTCESSSGTSAA